MDSLQRKSAGDRPKRYGGDVRISDDEWITDARTGELRLSERGITRQREDILARAGQLGAEVCEWYTENDTTAFKKKRIRLPNGRSVWRVYRPEFRRMLADYEDGKIDGIIFYDIDRLARQPRDLEDLIDLVEFYKRPVETVTGNIDLRTSNGRAMARVLVAMANKSSEDTSRRVARAWLQSAQEGTGNRWVGRRRRFGYDSDGSIIEAEAEVIRDGARRFVAGESWNSVVRAFEASGHRPVRARYWTAVSVQQILLNPSTAGIAVYNGSLRQDNEAGRSTYLGSDPAGVALRDAAGKYVMGRWSGVLTVKQWEAVVSESAGRRKGRTASAKGTRKYLLSGLLRCGCIGQDGGICNRAMSGFVQYRKSGYVRHAYRCPSKAQGGCGGIERNMGKLDALIEDLLFAHITANAPDDGLAAVPDEDDPDMAALADVQARLLTLRQGYAAVPRTVSDDTMFNVVPMLEASEREIKSRLARKARAQAGKLARSVSAEDVRREWDDAATDVGVRRAILSRYLKAVIVRKSSHHGPGELDYQSIEPVWREDGEQLHYNDIG